ncbi:MAG: cytochrome c biogenesis heme-transporting ATPase CcmA [Pseudomonadota bacterium]
MTHKLKAERLSLFRGERCLFHSIDFALESGELLLLRGPNGSGKTSLLRGLCGLLDFDDGILSWDGEDIGRNRQDFRARFAWYGHKTGFKSDLTAEENLRFERYLRAASGRDIREAIDRLGLTRQRQLPVRSLSAGQQRRASLARLLLSGVDVWVIDEPFTNLDAEGRGLVESLVAEHVGRGGMAIVATHHDMLDGQPVKTLEIGQ